MATTYRLKSCFGLATLLLAMLLFCISFGTQHWIQGRQWGSRIRLGLWGICLNRECISIFENHRLILHTLGGWMYIVQWSAALGLACACAVIFLSILHCWYKEHSQRQKLLLLQTAFLIVAGIFYGFAMGLFAYNMDRKVVSRSWFYGYSFKTGITAVIAAAASALLFFLDRRDTVGIRIEYIPIK